jgi:hypothetical protein
LAHICERTRDIKCIFFIFDALHAYIELIKVIYNTRYNGLKADDNATDSEGDFNIDSRGFIRRSRMISNGAWISFYHEFNYLDFSRYQIFSLEQLTNSNELSTDHCFVNCLKYFNINHDTIEFAKDIIRGVLPHKHLNKICDNVKII